MLAVRGRSRRCSVAPRRAKRFIRIKIRPELTVPVVAKYMRVAKDDPAVVEAQRTVGQLLNQNLPPSLEGVRFVLDHYAERQPSLLNKNPADFVDMRFVRKLEEEGFFKKFASK